MEISNYVLKLTGKSELPQPIDLGNNYNIALSGSVRTSTDSDNDDGTLSRIYTFKPVKIELLTETGETIKLKDTRSNSQLLRSLIYKRWVNAASKITFDEFYDKVIGSAMVNVDKIIDWAQVE
jgi:hypothetical protein